jgi:hypothetical protein
MDGAPRGGERCCTDAMPSNLDDALKSARASQKQSTVQQVTGGVSVEADVEVSLSNRDVREIVVEWLQGMTSGDECACRKPGGSRVCDGLHCKNPEQEEVVRLIAGRVLQEHQDMLDGCIGRSEPVSALITGGPGVGKSFVVKAARQLFGSLDYGRGVEYGFTALQAVVALQLGGDTLHGMFGLNLFGQPSTAQSKITKISASLSRMRWLIIDEISQVTCELLSQCEQQARCMVQDVGTYRLNGSKGVRAWAGINVLFVGDFLQLPPPGSGTCLTSIPDDVVMKLHPKKATITHGLSLMWDGVNQLIELKEQVRCSDPWWNAVLGEFRVRQLTKDTHAFLHGQRTSVPGSWTEGTCTCGNSACAKLCGSAWKRIKENECKACRDERRRRVRVVAQDDDRLNESKFQKCIAIVANNDLKHEICKVRAAQHARDTDQRIVWASATDTAMVDALIHDTELRNKKIDWQQYHHRKCNSLWGMLPLVVGMRVALVDHLDRSTKCLLRGSNGTLTGWQLDPREPQHSKHGDIHLKYPPKALIVQFDECSWTLDGMPTPGAYPVKPSKKSWYVDSNRRHPVLRVNRSQLPVGPDYARTAYSTQGLTLDAAMVDLCFDESADAATAYVALSRVRSADDILIMQPFTLDLFQKGMPIGPKLLLKKLRGECIEEDIEEHLQSERERKAQEAEDKQNAIDAKHEDRIGRKRVVEKKKRQAETEREGAKKTRADEREKKAKTKKDEREKKAKTKKDEREKTKKDEREKQAKEKAERKRVLQNQKRKAEAPSSEAKAAKKAANNKLRVDRKYEKRKREEEQGSDQCD